MRSLKHYNRDAFILKLSNMSWESVLMCFDVEMAWDSFKTIFHSVLDSVAPVKEVKLKQRTEPCMNSKILQNIRFRDETLNKFEKQMTLICIKNIVNLGTLCREKLGYQKEII